MIFASSSGDSLTGMILIALMVAVLAAVGLRQQSRRRAMFLACAQQLGAKLLDADGKRLSAKVRGLRLEVELEQGSDGSPNRTHVIAKAKAPFALVLYLRPQTPAASSAVQKGEAIDVLIGDPILDPQWIIEGAPRERVARMFEDPALRAMLRRFHDVREPSVRIEDNHVKVSHEGFTIVENVLGTEWIELALALAKAATAESARPREASQNGDYRTAPRPDGRDEGAEIAALKRLRATSQIGNARLGAIFSQLAVPGLLLYMKAASLAHPQLDVTDVALLATHLVFAMIFLRSYLLLCTIVGPSPTDKRAFAVVGLVNVLLLGLVGSRFLR